MPTYLTDPDLCFLNHGSFGSTPQEILDIQNALRLEMELRPIDFLNRDIAKNLLEARKAVADFIHSDLDGTFFVNNATTGINAVLASFPLQTGDEILTTDHRYDAVRNTLDHTAARRNARVVEARIPFPLRSSQQIIDAIEASITPRTRLLVIDQITSPTALILPVAQIVSMAHERGLPILIDGAHSPGQIDVDIHRLSPDFWVGNLHKWLCAPKGCAALYVAPKWRETIHPTVISHGYGSGIAAQFDWTGTSDPTAWLCAPHVIEMHKNQGGAVFRAAHHSLVQQGRQVIANALEVSLPHPDDAKLYGSMATIPLPCRAEDVPELFQQIRREDHIEVPIIVWDKRAWTRISGFAGYNRPEQYVRLANALRKRLIDA